MLLQLIADFSAFTLLLIPGLVYLFIEHDLKIYEIVTAVILLLMTTGLSGILLLGIWKPLWLQRLFAWAQRTANWLFGRLRRSLTLADDWAQKNADEFNQAARAAAEHPSRSDAHHRRCPAGSHDGCHHLYLLFLAFQPADQPGGLVAGYAIGILFWIVSITPQGIGVVEGMMALTFTSLGIPGAVAATVALAFRGLTFWLPMLLGFFAVQRLRTLGRGTHTLTETWGVRFAAVLIGTDGRDQRAFGSDTLPGRSAETAGAIFPTGSTARRTSDSGIGWFRPAGCWRAACGGASARPGSLTLVMLGFPSPATWLKGWTMKKPCWQAG